MNKHVFNLLLITVGRSLITAYQINENNRTTSETKEVSIYRCPYTGSPLLALRFLVHLLLRLLRMLIAADFFKPINRPSD